MKIKISELKSRTFIICSTWIERENIISKLTELGYSHIGHIDEYNIAPNIDVIPIQMQFQTFTRNSVILKKTNIKIEYV